MRTRPAAVAGRFYPADPAGLAALVDRLLAAAPPEPEAVRAESTRPVAVVAPHAGYQYSGAVAAGAYAQLARHRDDIGRVVVLGPAHFVPLAGLAVPGVDAFATPLGPVPVDAAARATATALPGVAVDDEPHAVEHSLETQLPFLQRVLDPAVPVLPVVVGEASPERVAALLAALAAPDTVTVVSTDLSHYLDVTAARERDARTVGAILALEDRALRPGDACGYHPLRGLLRYAAEHDLRGRLLRLATSADVGSDPSRVVGYGAFVFSGR
jgi:MEMO1 family protein